MSHSNAELIQYINELKATLSAESYYIETLEQQYEEFHWEVRLAVAKQGFALEELSKDEHRIVRLTANEQQNLVK
jgi:hypothetical protein